jgi:DNA polymerase-3 subunit delta
MADRRAVVVRSAERIRNAEPLLAYLKSPSPTTVLVLLSAKPDFRLKLFQALKAAGSVVECKTPYDSAIPAWIESEAARRGKSITPGAAALVHVAAGRSLTAIAAELEKLGVYVGDKPRIDEDDVRMVVGSTKEYTIFDLMNAVGRREEAPSLRILDRMLEQGESMTSCVVQLTKYFQKLWVLGAQGSGPADAAAKSLGIHPYFLREYAEAARRHSRGAVERAFAALKEADVALKTSAGTPRTVMTLLIHALTA